MSDATASGHAQPQEFEKVLSGSDTSVASFDTHHKTPLEKAQHFLHSNPAAVPLIVLVLSIAVFGVLVGGKFFSAFSMTLILQQVAVIGIVGAAQTLVILTAGIDLSVGAIMVLSSVVMGQFTFRYGLPAPIAILCGFAVGALCGWVNGVLIAHMKLPPFIVTLGTWQIILAANFLYSAQRDHPLAGHRRPGADPAALRSQFPHRQRRLHLWRGRHGAAGRGAMVHPQPHGLGPPRLRRRRRSRSRRSSPASASRRCSSRSTPSRA